MAKTELDELLDGDIEVAPEGLLAEEAIEDILAIEAGYEAGAAPSVEIDKSALYEGQESNFAVADEEEAAPKKGKKAAKTKTNKAPKAAKAPAPEKETKEGVSASKPNTGITLRSEAFEKKASREDLKGLGFDDEGVQHILASMDAAPKKVSEKGYNILRYALGREHISNYTRFALEQLQFGHMTVPALVEAMKARGWSEGTSRSQSQQMSRLFQLFGMATKDGGVLRLDTDAILTKAVLARLKAPAPEKVAA